MQFAYDLPGVSSPPPHTPGGWPAGNSLACFPSLWRSCDWLVNWTNQTPSSPFSTANHTTGICTHNLRRNHGRLSRLRSIEIWQLHRWDNRPEAVSLSISVFFPEHYSLWAWGCHSQKTTSRSLIIPAAWAKRKRTGRLKKVRLVLGGNEAIIISWQTAWILSMPVDWQPLCLFPPRYCGTTYSPDC